MTRREAVDTEDIVQAVPASVDRSEVVEQDKVVLDNQNTLGAGLADLADTYSAVVEASLGQSYHPKVWNPVEQGNSVKHNVAVT